MYDEIGIGQISQAAVGISLSGRGRRSPGCFHLLSEFCCWCRGIGCRVIRVGGIFAGDIVERLGQFRPEVLPHERIDYGID